MDLKALDRITRGDRDDDYSGNWREVERQRLINRHVQERRDHRFSENIGGHSGNYREPYFGR